MCRAGSMASLPGSREMECSGIRVLDAEEARANASSMDTGSGLGHSAMTAGTMVRVGTGLPPIPKRLVDKIQADEYVDFSELPPAKGKSRVAPIQGDGQIVVVQAADLLQTRKIIPDLTTWAQCFAIYAAVRGAHQPNKLADLMGYQSLVARASKKFKWPLWVIYEQNFQQEAAGNDELQWTKVEPSLYTQCFTGQDISRENWCAKCQGLDHQSVDCPYSAGRKRPWNSGPGAGGHNQLKAGTGTAQEQQTCIKFNRYQGDCRFGKDCKFLHACSSCGGPHPVSRCRAGNADQQKQGK